MDWNLRLREETFQDPRGHTNNAHRGDNIFLDVADENQFFFTQANTENESKEKIFERKERSRQDAKEWVANETKSSSNTSVKDLTKGADNAPSFSVNRTKAKAWIQVEHGIDLSQRISN